MSTKLHESERVDLTRYWGGSERGPMVQVTFPTTSVESPAGSPHMYFSVPWDEALRMARAVVRQARKDAR